MPSKVSASGFAALPYKLMDQADAATWAVYAVLHRHGWNSDQGCWVSINTIHVESGISQFVIRRSLSWLRETGWIESIERPGYTTVHHVKTDAPEPLTNLTPLKNKRDSPLQKPKGTPYENPRGPLAKTQDEQEPKNKNPRTKTPKRARASADADLQKKDPNRLKKLPLSSVPGDLSGCGELLVEYWSVKGGVRSTSVLNRICNTLRQWSLQDRRAALEAAISGGWANIYPPKKQSPYSGSQSTTDWDALDNVSFFPNS